jgi:hypothetical protein
MAEDANRENPHVTSKFDRDHGEPRSPGKVEHPGGTAEPTFAHERHAPSVAKTHSDGHKQHTYHHGHPAMGGAEHGAKAKHPYHDHEQEAYEDSHGYGDGAADGK